jgi:hypothetical protein
LHNIASAGQCILLLNEIKIGDTAKAIFIAVCYYRSFSNIRTNTLSKWLANENKQTMNQLQANNSSIPKNAKKTAKPIYYLQTGYVFAAFYIPIIH